MHFGIHFGTHFEGHVGCHIGIISKALKKSLEVTQNGIHCYTFLLILTNSCPPCLTPENVPFFQCFERHPPWGAQTRSKNLSNVILFDSFGYYFRVVHDPLFAPQEEAIS